MKPKFPKIIFLAPLFWGAVCVAQTDSVTTEKTHLPKFSHLSTAQGLSQKGAFRIRQNRKVFLGLATSEGRNRYDGYNYTVFNHIPPGLLRFSSNDMFRVRADRGGINWIKPFFLRHNIINVEVPQVVITDFRVFNKSVSIQPENATDSLTLPQHISETGKITLSYRENVITFEFAAPDFNVTEKNEYAYLLEGFDRDWNYVGNQCTATYTNLDPGSYIFRVMCSNNARIWNATGTSVTLIITPPWWRTGWAYLLYFCAIVGLLIAGRKYELNRQQLRYELELEHIQAEKLSEIDQAKTRFFANISHEFRTPLSLISGPIEELLAKTTSENDRRGLQQVKKHCARLLELINQLLDLSQFQSGQMVLQTQKTNLTNQLRGLVMNFESLANLRGLRLTFSGLEQPVFGYVDRDKLEKIISNLLSNAIKFTPKGGFVSVEMYLKPPNAKPALIEIIVSDNGIGIPPDQISHIFDRFYQVDTTITRRFEGTGIGLALVKELVELHHGRISVVSELEKGTSFIVQLPLGKGHLKPAEIIDDESQIAENEYGINVDSQQNIVAETDQKMEDHRENADETKMRPLILIVEDNRDVRQYICESLKKEFRTITAENGKTGLQIALSESPDLVISDVMMPEMDGFVFCEKLKSDERTSHIPVILLTAHATQENKLTGLETGADAYLTKPFNAPELLLRIKNLTEQRRKLRQRFQEEIRLLPADVAVNSTDKRFLQKAIAIIEHHMSDPDFSAEMFSTEMAMHRVHLNRKIKALSGQTTTLFIRSIRLKRAAQLLTQKSGNISEIAYEVGFNNPAFFSLCFREQFGVSPSEFVQHNK